MSKTKLLLLLLFISLSGFGQADSSFMLKKNAVYVEAGGNGCIYSINYERVLYQKNKMNLCGRIGLMAFPKYNSIGSSDLIPFRTNVPLLMFPVEMNMVIGKKNYFFETGIGNTYNTVKYEKNGPFDLTLQKTTIINYHSHYAFLRLGYRYQSPESGFMFRIAVLPFINYKPGYDTEFPNEQKFGSIYDTDAYEPYKYELGIWGGVSVGYTF